MNKKKINSFLLGLIIAINVLLITNLLQFFVVNKCVSHFINENITISESSEYDTVVNFLINNAKKISVIRGTFTVIREIIVFLEVYILIWLLGKKYYISVVKLQTTIITIFVVEIIPIVYNIINGSYLKATNIIYLLICIAIYFAIMYKFLVDKEEAEAILEAREIYRSEKLKNKNKDRNKRSIKNSNIKGGK